MIAVLVTRPAGRADRLVELLAAHGLRVDAVPTVAMAPLSDSTALDRAVDAIAMVDWVVLTSPEGVRVLRERLGVLGRMLPPGRPRIAAVGPATSAALAAAGTRPDLVAPEPSGAALARALGKRVAGQRVLLLRADAAGPDLPDALALRGAVVEDVAAYRTIEGPASSRVPLRQALADPDLGCAVVGSGSAVRGLLALAEPASDVLAIPLVAIGPPTALVARRAAFATIRTAAAPTADALLEAVRSLLSARLGSVA
jgi:uroporphyrinogen III methyltransferase/synthase